MEYFPLHLYKHLVNNSSSEKALKFTLQQFLIPSVSGCNQLSKVVYKIVIHENKPLINLTIQLMLSKSKEELTFTSVSSLF